MVSPIYRPTSTIRSVCQERPIGWAIVVCLVVGLITAIARINFWVAFFEDMGLPDLGMPTISILNIVRNAGSTHCHLPSSRLGAGWEGELRRAFLGACLCRLAAYFSCSPGGHRAATSRRRSALRSGDFRDRGVVSRVVLHILAVRENCLVSTGRAILISLLSSVVLMVLEGLLV